MISEEAYRREQSVIQDLYNVCLAGKFGVGKTTIFKCVMDDDRSGDHRKDTGGVVDHEYTVTGFPSNIMLHDTGGLERHSISMGNYYRHCGCVVFVYDVTNMETLHYLKKEFEFIMGRGYCDTDTKFVILRNKIDVPTERVEVTKEFEADYLKNNEYFGNSVCHLAETSGIKNIGIKDFFKKDLIDILQGVNPVKLKKDIFEGYYKCESRNSGNCCT